MFFRQQIKGFNPAMYKLLSYSETYAVKNKFA